MAVAPSSATSPPSVRDRLLASRAFITSLPYVDTEFEAPELRAEAERLVRAEMRTFEPPDYLHGAGADELDFSSSLFLQHEYDRVARGEAMPQLDTERYRLPRPSADDEDAGGWRAALCNAHAQLQHQHTRLLNLELFKKFGTNAWRAHINALVPAQRCAQRDLAAVQAQCEALNARRKAVQERHGAQLRRLAGKRAHMLDKNMALAHATDELEREVKRLRAAATSRGINVEIEQGERGSLSPPHEMDGMDED
eukprot:g2041.t1